MDKRSALGTHVSHREDLFALEWALRSLKLPDEDFIQIEQLRNSWTKGTADRAMSLLRKMSGYYHVRDLVVTTKRGGYVLSTPAENEFHFADDPNWLGFSDTKSRLISEQVSADRNVIVGGDPEAFTLEQTTLYEDFPHDIKGESYSASGFWSVWSCLWRMCLNKIREDCEIRRFGDYAATSETKTLGILITKRKLTDIITDTTGLGKPTVSMFLAWMTLNPQTPSKFTLFHCPLVEINTKFVMIPSHAPLMAHVPTVFLRHVAHNDKYLYDACSGAMEKGWLRRLQNHIETTNRTIRVNIKLDTSEGAQELDLVEYDKAQSLLSIAQAKLTIRSDTVAEVAHKNEMLKKGIEQLKRDRRLLEGGGLNTACLLAKLGEEAKVTPAIRYFLLPTKTVPSDYVDIPSWITVLPIEFCLRPQCRGQSLAEIHEEYQARWNALDCDVTSSKCENELEIAGFKIVYPAFKV